MSSNSYPILPPSGIGEVSKYNFAPWYIKLRFQDQSLLKDRNWKEATKPLSSVQSRVGNEFEDSVYADIEPSVKKHINNWYEWGSDENKEQLCSEIMEHYKSESDDPLMMTQVRLNGEIGVFEVSGDADLILVYNTPKGVHIHVIDIKSSWEEKPSQQLQAATYANLVRQNISGIDVNYTIGAGIIYRDTDLDSVLSNKTVPSFQTKSREGDVERVLRDGGPFTRAFNNTFDNLPISFNRNSSYAEVSAVESIENNDLAILGLSEGERNKLANYGVESIIDVAKLYNLPQDPKPYNYEEPEIRNGYKDTVMAIQENTGLSERLSVISQKAQALLGSLGIDKDYTHNKPWLPWIIGSGSGNLPEDDPPFETDLPIREASMIRVYLNVQYDHVRDSIVGVSGVITSGRYSGSPLEFSKVDTEFERDNSTWKDKSEKSLLEDSISELFETVQFLADYAGHGVESAMHMYFYEQSAYESFYDAIRRHEDSSDEIAKMRGVLDSRRGIDQQMVSIVEDEISSRLATKHMDTSLQSIIELLSPKGDNAEFGNWECQTDDQQINLKDAFKQQMFDNYVPVKSEDNNIQILNKRGENTESNTFYKITPRSGSQIPIEYLWSCKDVDILTTDWAEQDRQKSIIESYQWVDADKKQVRIDSEIYKSLSRKLAHALHHAERSIVYRNTDIEKQPIDISRLFEYNSETQNDLSDACFDYLDLESQNTENEALEIYSKPIRQRIIEGESAPMIVTNQLEDKGYMFKVEGQLLYDSFSFDDPSEVISSSKITGGETSGGGSRCVATPLIEKSNGYEPAVDNPSQISLSTKVTVEDFDEDTGSIIIKGYRTSRGLDYRYVKNRRTWTLDASEKYKQYVGPGQAFILDPSPDNMMAEKSIKCLNNLNENPVYNEIQCMRSGEYKSKNTDFSRENASNYLDWVDSALEFSPNSSQSDFIQDPSRYSLLQGPPGTGKTSGGLAHAICSRIYDSEQHNKQLTGLVTGLSNKSIDELMEDVSALIKSIDNEFETHPMSNIKLIRLGSDPDEDYKNVRYINYRTEDGLDYLRRNLPINETSTQATLDKTEGIGNHVILFSTPGQIDGLMDSIDEEESAKDMYENPEDVFNMIAIDEGSMMPMYQMFMVTQFITSNGQLMIAGDQRQLPPVQKYDWKDERRKNIINNLPHLSCLDYFRYLRGDDVDGVYDESPKSPSIDIPLQKLEKTYRCHTSVTEFLRKTIYTKDNIPYRSDQTETISVPSLEEIIGPDYPITLIIHNDRYSQQYNDLEKEIVSKISENIPDQYTKGIVTPHNSQKGRLKTVCKEETVDTVERFQGGEKDVMFLSTTVSDPEYLSKEEDFILSENRLNVALSRMKKKLVVIASESIFELVPKDTETYDQANIWKELYRNADATNSPSWSGKLTDMGVNSPIDDDIEIYHFG